MNIIFSPANIVVFLIFITFLSIFIKNAFYIDRELKSLIRMLKNFQTDDLQYRFQELNESLLKNPFISDHWREFKETLIFGNKVVYKTNDNELFFESTTGNEAVIYCTSDANYFFNEETLIYQKLNYKLVSSIPSLLTGLGPLGTFLFIAIGFSGVNFSSEDATLNSVTNLMTNMQYAAAISITAIGSSLCFIIIERILYYFLCKKPLTILQIEINRLFKKIMAETFLMEIIKEAKRQNNSMNKHMENMSEEMKNAFDKSINSNLTPYLENMIMLLNKQQETFSRDIVKKILGS